MEPIRVQSLKAACIQRLEGLILSGQWQIGARLSGIFFRCYSRTPGIGIVLDFHCRLADAIVQQEAGGAAAVMDAMLRHGAEHLQQSAE